MTDLLSMSRSLESLRNSKERFTGTTFVVNRKSWMVALSGISCALQPPLHR